MGGRNYSKEHKTGGVWVEGINYSKEHKTGGVGVEGTTVKNTRLVGCEWKELQ